MRDSGTLGRVSTHSELDATVRSLTEEAGGAPDRTHHILVGDGILAEAAAHIVSRRPDVRDLIVCDENTAVAAAHALSAALKGLGRDVTLLILEPAEEHEELVCDDEAVALLEDRLRKEPDANPVAVGSGTVNDIVKMAAMGVGRRYQSVATAASMNGYTSAIAAILSRGVKRTLPAYPPEAVFADVGVIARAPAYLNQAGFGDLLSKPFSHADWLLSHLVRDLPYDERPARLLDDAYDALLAQAGGVGHGDLDAIGTLTRTILVSGFSMAIAGTSSPASGGEHLVSHYWDMERHCQHQPLLALHGTQVGIATRLSAMLFERLVSLDARDIDPALEGHHTGTGWLDDLQAIHPSLSPDVVDEVREQIGAKQLTGAQRRAELEAVRARWPEIREALRDVLVSSARIGEVLRQAGAADRPSMIGVDRAKAVHTLRVCRHIRGRYVALDLMDDLGKLHGWAAEVVDACEA